MNGGPTARATLLGVICALFFNLPLNAQSLEHVERCLPYPTLAQEIWEMRGESSTSEAGETSPSKAIKIEVVEFKSKGNSPLAPVTSKMAIAELKRDDLYAFDNWPDEVAEFARMIWQDHGFFTVTVDPSSSRLREDSQGFHASITLLVDEGKRFRLGDLRIKSADPSVGPLPISEPELRSLIPLQKGEIFRTSKIRRGLDVLKNRFGDEGYIDFTAAPHTDVDMTRGVISLTLELDPQRQFRIGDVKITGLEPKVEKRLKLVPKSGEIFHHGQIQQFYAQNRTLLPPGTEIWNSLHIERDVRHRTADLLFQFRTPFTCPQWDD